MFLKKQQKRLTLKLYLTELASLKTETYCKPRCQVSDGVSPLFEHNKIATYWQRKSADMSSLRLRQDMKEQGSHME